MTKKQQHAQHIVKYYLHKADNAPSHSRLRALITLWTKTHHFAKRSKTQ